MVVVYGCNSNWYKYLVVNIHSLLRHNKCVNKIYILCENDTIKDIDYLEEINNKFDVCIKVIDVREKISEYFDDKYNRNTIYTDFAYAKLLISEIIEEDIALYLDTDTIVRDDISSIMSFNIDNYYAAGVKDNGGYLDYHKEKIGIFGDYINTGVMLLNCKKIRDDKVTKKFFDVINSMDLKYPDQDAFNKVCSPYVMYIPSAYNFAMNNDFYVTRYVYNKKCRKIIHFTGRKIDWVADKYFAEDWYDEYNEFYYSIINDKHEKNINVAFCSNRKLYKYLAINVNSLLKYNKRIKKIYLVLEDDDISQVDLLNDVIKKYDVEVEVVNFIDKQFNYLDEKSDNFNTKFTNFCFAKLLLSEFTNEDKIVYLDMDTIVRGDISLLWNLDIDNYYALGVKDYGVLDSDYHYGTLNTKCKYINTGVMVLNLDKIRKDGLVKKLFDYINNHKLVYPDQDAFNIVCDSSIQYIPSAYNCASVVTRTVAEHESVKIFHYPGDKTHWVTDRNFAEEYFEELEVFRQEFNLDRINLY